MVFVDDLDEIELDEGDRHHLARALRLNPGDQLTVCDGAGGWRPARFGDVVEPDGEVVAEPFPAPRLTVGFCPVKGDRSDLVVQKLTELGIDVIVPVLAERSVVRWDEARAAKNRERHRRIAREAAMQSKNPWLPTIEPLTDLSRFLADRPDAILADPVGGPALGGSTAVAVGPEGGFSPAELQQRPSVALPGRILRTETAAIAAGVTLAAGRDRVR